MNNDIILIPKKECLRDYVVYQNINYDILRNKKKTKKKTVTKKNTKKNNNSSVNNSSSISPTNSEMEQQNILQKKQYGGPYYVHGIIRNGFLYKSLGNCYFRKDMELTENEKKNLEKNYKKLSKKELSKDGWIKDISDYECNKDKKIEILEKKGIPYNMWIYKSEKFYLKIEDIIKLKKGTKIKVLILDSDIENFIKKKNKINKIYKPKEFFRENCAEITIDNELRGLIKFQFQQEKEKPYKFNFYVNHIKGRWHPVFKGNIYIYETTKFGTKKTIVNWEKIDKKNYIGFGGHLILWENLDKLPNIFFTSIK